VVIRLTGVIQDGTERAIGVPANPRRAIRALDADDLTVELTVVRPSGQAEDLSPAGTTVTMRIGKKSSAGAVAKLKDAVGTLVDGGGGGRTDITFTAANLEEIRNMVGLAFDIFLVKSGTRFTVVPLSGFALDATIGD
jgi:hypothetical protein